MKNISIFFDYMFYRVAKAYAKWDVGHGNTGIIAVTWTQTFLILDTFIILLYYFYDKSERIIVFSNLKFYLISIVVLLVFFNYRRYNTKYWSLHSKWKDELKEQKIKKGILVFLAILLPLIIPMIIFSL